MIQKHHRFQCETDFRIKQVPESTRFQISESSRSQNITDSRTSHTPKSNYFRIVVIPIPDTYKSTRFLKFY